MGSSTFSNNECQTVPQHILWHGTAWLKYQLQPDATKAKCLPAKKKKKKKRKLLVAEIHKEDQDISAKALKALWKLQHFYEYPIRDKFQELFLKNGSEA